MRARLPLLLLAALCGCVRRADEPAALLSEARRRLAARDARLASYRLEGTTREGARALDFHFTYRAPQRMRGWLGAPASRTFAWDGERLFEQSDGERRFTTFQAELPPDKRAGFLTETFAPFTPEGFRAPLLPRDGVSARRTTHPRAPAAVELTVRLEDAGEPLEVTYVLRWPSLDFLGKRTRGAGSTAEVRVVEEHCDEALALCVPRRLTRWSQGQAVGETALTRVELNPALPAHSFTLRAPEGYEVQTRTLVDAAAR